jgi:glutamyl-tRNA reductase
MIDLAMPRDIDPDVKKLDNVYLYDLDSIQLKAEQSLADRKRESKKCFDLIERHVHEFQRSAEHSPAVVPATSFPSLQLSGRKPRLNAFG